MIDWKQITGLEWDADTERKSIEKHTVSRFEADQKHSENETRYHALGKSNGARLLHITFTLRSDNTLIRVISARDMHRKKRNIYEQN